MALPFEGWNNLLGRYTLKCHFSGQKLFGMSVVFPLSADNTDPYQKNISQTVTSKMRLHCVTTSAKFEEQPSSQGRNIYLG